MPLYFCWVLSEILLVLFLCVFFFFEKEIKRKRNQKKKEKEKDLKETRKNRTSMDANKDGVVQCLGCRPNMILENGASIDCPLLAVYGGGDAIQLAARLSCIRVEGGSFPPHFLEKVIEDAKTAYKKWTKIESVAPIIQYPSEFPSSPSPSPSSPPPSSSDCFETTISLCVYHPANPSLPQTTFFQGWMFDGEIEQGRLGVSRYPLIGLYQNNHGFLFPSSSSPSSPSSSSKGGEESSNELSEFSPMNSLSPADQHVHLVEETLELDGFLMELKDWNFGGPMAKLVLNPEQLSLNPHSNVASGLVACVDLKRKRIHLCGLFVVCGERPKESIDRQFLMKQSTGLLKDFIETLPHFDPQIGL